jgi:hypothetical protein
MSALHLGDNALTSMSPAAPVALKSIPRPSLRVRRISELYDLVELQLSGNTGS